MRGKRVRVVLAIVFLIVAFGMSASASTPPTVSTVGASNVTGRTATLNGNLSDMGLQDNPIPPVRQAGPTVAVSPGFNTVGTIDTTGSNFLLIIVGGCQIYDGTLNSVTTSPVNTVGQVAFSGKQVPGGEGNISDAFFVTNPSISVSYQVTAAWSAGSCSYGSKYVTLYTFSGVNTTAPMMNNANTTADNFNGFSPFTTSFPSPAGHQVAIFTEVTTDQDQNFKDVHLVNMTGLSNAWTYGSSANCGSGGGWCPAGGIGPSRTAVTFTANNIDFAATSWFINGTIGTIPRTSVDVYFEWGASPSLGFSTSHVAKSAPTLFQDNITGLSAFTTYYFRACGTPTTTCGDILQFTTSFGFDLVGMFGLAAFLVIALSMSLFIYKVMRRRPGGGAG